MNDSLPSVQELAQLQADLSSRQHLSSRERFRQWMWGVTIRNGYRLKRSIDVIASLAAILVFSPLLLGLAIAVKTTSPGPIIFSQVRVGRFGRHFRFYKFRSMYQDAEARKAALASQNESKDGVIFKMKNDPRITPVGRVLRKFSLDELPQLFNVLAGDMSLVGPRPPVPSEVAQYTLEDRKRLNVIPGITCIWQVSGRSEIPFNEQVRLDKEYIGSHGFGRDLVILLKTVPAILSGKGAY